MPLKIAIVGAGIGGLGAAIALTRAGHDVEVFEKSSFHNEVGAAIHVAPNATRVLDGWEVDVENLDPVRCESLSVYTAEAEFITTFVETKKLQDQLGVKEEWLLVHRVDLHDALKAHAERGFEGRKPSIHLSTPVKSVDAEKGVVYLENGSEMTADLIVGADGVHSASLRGVTGEPAKKKSTGQSCYRFLIHTEKIRAHAATRALLERIGTNTVTGFNAENSRLVVYPCRRGELMNCVLMFDSDKYDDVSESWHNEGDHADLMKLMEGYAPELRELGAMGEDVKLWSLASRDPPTKFINGKLALIGDAAHPTLPHQGQGGAQALEDAAALGALFTRETQLEDISSRLELYNKIRYDRAVTVLFMSRKAEDDRGLLMDELKKFVPRAEKPRTVFEYTWASDPVARVQEATA
ncbi:hypothetical protein ACN47E_009694 [Coniothyrium glycines]